jgi:2-oxoglutarate ferredoxin oxidoreductase subunit alpha
MVIGAVMAGARAMTSSSSPEISLEQEGISFAATMELPMVIVDTMRRTRARKYRAVPGRFCI